jgi:hypothetical protein
VDEIASSVWGVFGSAGIPHLEEDQAIDDALGRLRNVLAELAGLYAAITSLPGEADATIVHDYAGVGAWMQNQWEMTDPIVKEVVSASNRLALKKNLELQFVHQRGHSSSWAGRHDLARFNGRADSLAAGGAYAHDWQRGRSSSK